MQEKVTIPYCSLTCTGEEVGILSSTTHSYCFRHREEMVQYIIKSAMICTAISTQYLLKSQLLQLFLNCQRQGTCD